MYRKRKSSKSDQAFENKAYVRQFLQNFITQLLNRLIH